MTAQRVHQDPSDRPLPSFEMPWLDSVDPDRTLKRHAIRVEPRVAPSASSTEEISVEDVLEVVNVGRVSPHGRPRPEATEEIRPRTSSGPRSRCRTRSTRARKSPSLPSP